MFMMFTLKKKTRNIDMYHCFSLPFSAVFDNDRQITKGIKVNFPLFFKTKLLEVLFYVYYF